MNITHNDNDPRQKTRLSRDEPDFWRTSRAIRRITGGMNTGVRTLHAVGPRPVTRPVSTKAALCEERYRLGHETPERLTRDFAGIRLRRFT
jgi:hypothetical protein